MNEKKRGVGVFFLLALIIGLFVTMLVFAFASGEDIPSDSQINAYLEDESLIDYVTVEPIKQGDSSMAKAVIYLIGGKKVEFYVSDVEAFRNKMLTEHPNVRVIVSTISEDSIWSILIPLALIILGVGVLVMLIVARMSGAQGSQMNDFSKSRAERIDNKNNPIRFDNVAGLYEEKEDMREIVEFLRDPKKFTRFGARIPKGILLVGPPGTGKTYLAKAVAGEAGVPFFSISGSDFVEMFVGVGAARVRDMFQEAKKNSPCIVFIDEIDAVGRKRGAGLGGSHDEREQTLNQLLVEMDGFTFNAGIIVLAATNRVDILDPALLRPGRFDRQVVVNRPDVKEREEVLAVHSKNKPLGSDVDLKKLAQLTAGFTPADLESLLNEAAIRAAKEKKGFITDDDIQAAFVKVTTGTEKKTRVISEKERSNTAYHEAGHAILFHVLDKLDEVRSISIIPTGMALGYTMPLSEDDKLSETKEQMKEEIACLLAGRVAEELKIGDVSTGASNDIMRATNIARNMVTRYGMSDNLGPVQYGKDTDEVFLGREINHERNYSEEVAAKIDAEVKALIEEGYALAKKILVEYDDVLERTRNELLAKEKITGEEFVALFEKAPAAEQTEEKPKRRTRKKANAKAEEKPEETTDEQ